jgi:hypothetical protein
MFSLRKILSHLAAISTLSRQFAKAAGVTSIAGCKVWQSPTRTTQKRKFCYRECWCVRLLSTLIQEDVSKVKKGGQVSADYDFHVKALP